MKIPPKIEGRPGVRKYTVEDITASLIYENGTVKIESDAAFPLKINDKAFAYGYEKSHPAGRRPFETVKSMLVCNRAIHC